MFQKDPGLSGKSINISQHVLSLSPTSGTEQGPEVKQRDSYRWVPIEGGTRTQNWTIVEMWAEAIVTLLMEMRHNQNGP